MRIVSLLPSATEIVCALGLADQLVGVSHECDFPFEVGALPKVTQTRIPSDATSQQIDAFVRDQLSADKSLYTLDQRNLISLRPDLIVTQTLCNVCAVAQSAVDLAINAMPNVPRVVNLQPTSLADVASGISEIAAAAGQVTRGKQFLDGWHQRIIDVSSRSKKIAPGDRPTVAFLEWIDPPFSAGHWTPEIVSLAGGIETIGQASQPSVRIDWETIVQIDPDIMVVACCGFDIDRMKQDVAVLESLSGWSDLKCVASKRVYLIDGSAYFNRPGPRLLDSLEILANALHSDIHPLRGSQPPAVQLL